MSRSVDSAERNQPSAKSSLKNLHFPHKSEATWGLVIEQWAENLCHACHELLSGCLQNLKSGSRWPAPRQHFHYNEDGEWVGAKSPRELQVTAHLGCYLCDVIQKVAVRQRLWDPESAEAEPWQLTYDFYMQHINPSTIAVFEVYMGAESIHEEISRAALIKLVTEDLSGPREPELMRYGLPWIRHQLQNCVANPHHDCLAPFDRDSAEWPARMLQITYDKIFLMDFDKEKMPGEFAALSYCWGSREELEQNPPYRATSSTLQELRAGVLIASLPQTLAQAVNLCILLDIWYIWIDSLCIIQDSRSDWMTEAAKMGEVYARSKLTIIAAASRSCHTGFLDLNLSLVDLEAPLKPPLRLVSQGFDYSGFHSLSFGGVADPIDVRGWTYQEEILSTRYIKITKEDVQWKCTIGTACLCGIGAHNDSLVRLDHKNTPRDLRDWGAIVENFSQRLFTVDTDKLPAISGVAKKLTQVIQSNHHDDAEQPVGYFAGIWAGGSLGYSQLLWYCHDPEASLDDTAGTRDWSSTWHRIPDSAATERYVSPSFSWISINQGTTQRIKFQSIETPQCHLAEMMGISTEPEAPDNPFGTVLGGAAYIQAPLLRARLYSHPEHPVFVRFDDFSNGFVIESAYFDCPIIRTVLSTGEASIKRSHQPQWTPHIALEKTDVWIALLGVGIITSGRTRYGYWGLVLGKLEAGYQRLGLVVLSRTMMDAEQEKLELAALQSAWELVMLY